jgi:photosystem II stability/assembly factor-like uncharacterized protein
MAKMWVGQTGQARFFMQDYGPGPENEPELLKCVNLEGLDWPQGDWSPIFCQGDDRYGQFEQVDEVQGAPESPSSSMNMLMSKRNPILNMVCPFNIYVHYGKCRDPNSFNLGWEIGFTYESARFEGKTSEPMVAHDGEGAEIHFGGAYAARDFFQHDPILFGPEATVEALGAEVVGIVVCDYVDCGDCGAPSDGCQRIYAVTAANVGSGINNPQVLATEDGGGTWTAYPIDCLVAVAGPPSPMACVGDILVVLGDPANLYATGEIAYAEFSDLTAWTCIADGLVANHYPHAIFSLNPLETWLVGEGGYIYFTSDPTTGVTVQSPADVTDATLRDVHFYNSEVGLAVGDAGTVVFTRNGGLVWQEATTNWTAMNLCCEAASEYVWWVGDEDGILHYTIDGGLTWGTKDIAALKGEICEIQDIQFGKPSVGFILVNQYSALYPCPGGEIAGQVFRTLNGGYSWYELPEPITGSIMPAADAFNSIATCGPNEIWIAGLADDHLNGVIVHGQGYS